MPFYEEISILADDFVKRITTNKGVGGNVIEFHKFCQLFDDSKLVEYIIQQLTFVQETPSV